MPTLIAEDVLLLILVDDPARVSDPILAGALHELAEKVRSRRVVSSGVVGSGVGIAARGRDAA